MTGHRLGRYHLLEKIGQGGMAEVWLGRGTVVGGSAKPCAVKVMLPHIADDPHYRQMFMTEARLCMQLTNANIVQVFDAGEEGASLYLAMEWVDGTDLATLLRIMRDEGIEVPLSVVGYVVGELLHALDYAHRVTSCGSPLGIVHRDVSPQNVMISAAGEVKLADFGVARVLSDESSHEYAKGKLRYMPREQLMGRPRPASDLFGVGAILHELLEGEKFRADRSEEDLYAAILGDAPPVLRRPGAPPELDRLRRALLNPEVGGRLQTAEEALLVLERWTGYRNARTHLRRLYRHFFGPSEPRSGLRAPGGPEEPRRPTEVIRVAVDPEASTQTRDPGDSSCSEQVLSEEASFSSGPRHTTRASGTRVGLVLLGVLGVLIVLLGLSIDRGRSGRRLPESRSGAPASDAGRSVPARSLRGDTDEPHTVAPSPAGRMAGPRSGSSNADDLDEDFGVLSFTRPP